jgi:colanic acid biosynthesis protein WcaH
MMDLTTAISVLNGSVPDPSAGLPDEVFYYISRTTPLVNVDLLIRNCQHQILLAWRDDIYAGRGWHVPGGIVRFKETFATRICKVAEEEVGCREIEFVSEPLVINQLINDERDVRGHFISLLFECRLPDSFVLDNAGRQPGEVGFLAWHKKCPDDIIRYHEIYRKYFA